LSLIYIRGISVSVCETVHYCCLHCTFTLS